MEKVEDCPKVEAQFFLPGFLVKRETTHAVTFRFVMNGAREFKGRSLNDFLLPGPNKMNSLADVLVRFRQHPHVLTCDIQHMFLGILVTPADRDYLKVFYRPNPEENVQVYRCTRHVFGLSCSPFIAMSTVLFHAQRKAYEWPLAYHLVRHHIIVDDILASFANLEEMKQAKSELTNLFGSMGLKPHKWASNCEAILCDVPEAERAKAITLDSMDWGGDSPCVRTLGILWHSEVDAFQFVFRPEEPPKWTLRSLASMVGKLYDPPCLLSPVTVQGKELLQLSWQHQDSWDQPLPEVIIKKARLYLKHHQHTERLLIARQAFGAEAELMIFADASTQALAAVAYMVSWMGGRRVSRLLWAKHKLASVKGNETVPRLELAAALMGTELAFFICKAFGWDLNRVSYFSDSLTILWWLQSTQALAPYVANRVKKILERSSFRQWLHVRTGENPADLPTRGTRSEVLQTMKIWWEGPDFLTTDPTTWEEQPELYETEEAAAEKRTLEALCKNVVMAARSRMVHKHTAEEWVRLRIKEANAFEKGCRIVNLVFAALTRMTREGKKYEDAGLLVWRSEQRKVFGQLYWQLETGKAIDKQFCDLQPFLDNQRLLRINSRLTPFLEAPREGAQPLLLHHRMEMAQLLAWELHAVDLKHCGGSGSD